ncbi:unnamed protein product, partial [Ixodes pacificus]
KSGTLKPSGQNRITLAGTLHSMRHAFMLFLHPHRAKAHNPATEPCSTDTQCCSGIKTATCTWPVFQAARTTTSSPLMWDFKIILRGKRAGGPSTRRPSRGPRARRCGSEMTSSSSAWQRSGTW